MGRKIDRRRFIAASAAGLSTVTGCLHLDDREDEADQGTPGEEEPEPTQEPTEEIPENPFSVPNLSWDFTTDDVLLSHPTVIDNVVYVGSNDGNLYALEGEDDGQDAEGDANWTQPRYGYGNLSSLDTAAPKEVQESWRFETGDKVKSQPAVVGDRVYFGSHDGGFYCIDRDTGEELWSHDTDGVIIASPSVTEDGVYITSFAEGGEGPGEVEGPGTLWKFDESTGELEYSVDVDGGVVSSPVVFDGSVYFGSYDGDFHAVDAESGDHRWVFETDGEICEVTAAVDPEEAVVYFGSGDGNLYAVDAEDGGEAWRFETEGWVISGPVLVDDRIFFGSFDRNAYAVDAETGEELWVFEEESTKFFGSPAYSDGVLYIPARGGNLHALDGETGDSIWTFNTPGGIASSPTVAGDMIYFGGEDDNRVYAVENELVDEDGEYGARVEAFPEDRNRAPEGPEV